LKTLLHIIASPRGDLSRTLSISRAFLKSFQESHASWKIDTLDLSEEKLPSLTAKEVSGKYVLLSGKELSPDLKEAWSAILDHINRFLAADIYLITTPMWNFSIPYMLKQYIDIIAQPNYLFKYTSLGSVEGLAKNKKMFVMMSRGGEYSAPLSQSKDFQEPYLRTIFEFVGITDITFVKAEPMDVKKDLREERLEKAKIVAMEIAKKAVSL